MEVTVHHGLDEAPTMAGVGVVIDVFRATTTIACCVEAGAERVLILDDPARIAHFCSLADHECFSEVVPEGHDNSPLTALRVPLRGRTAVISTASGTRAIHAARRCDRVFTAALANLDAVADYLRALSPARVSLLPAGLVAEGLPTIEDSLCASLLAARLQGRRVDERAARRRMRLAMAARRLDPTDAEDYPVYADLLFCSALGVLDVVPEVFYDGDLIHARDARRAGSAG